MKLTVGLDVDPAPVEPAIDQLHDVGEFVAEPVSVTVPGGPSLDTATFVTTGGVETLTRIIVEVDGPAPTAFVANTRIVLSPSVVYDVVNEEFDPVEGVPPDADQLQPVGLLDAVAVSCTNPFTLETTVTTGAPGGCGTVTVTFLSVESGVPDAFSTVSLIEYVPDVAKVNVGVAVPWPVMSIASAATHA